MRLLQSSSLELKDFSANQIPPYAILSHTWGEDEVLYTDMQEGKADGKAGYEKIQQSCKRAAADGYEYLWVDTCCIDKRSSAELSEAINSMFNWYQRAGVCYAYLADVSSDDDCEGVDSEFARSRWFKRGWTLQELIAPLNLVFMCRDWITIGRKSSLRNRLAEITGIDSYILGGQLSPDFASVAQRMSWASYRETTRKEDIAYCLMGLFGVSMPLLYGEEDKAFLRLQQEIIKNSDDHSLFAWVKSGTAADYKHGMLADSPASFAMSRKIVSHHDPLVSAIASYSMTNRGLSIDLPLTYIPEIDMYLAALNCVVPPKYSSFLCIFLTIAGYRQFARVKTNTLEYVQVKDIGKLAPVLVRQNLSFYYLNGARHFFRIRSINSECREHRSYKLIRLYTHVEKTWPSIAQHVLQRRQQDIEFTYGDNKLAGAISFDHVGGDNPSVLLGTINSRMVGFAMCSVSTNDLNNPEDMSSRIKLLPEQINMPLGDRSYRVTVVGREFYPEVQTWILDIYVKAIHISNHDDFVSESYSKIALIEN